MEFLLNMMLLFVRTDKPRISISHLVASKRKPIPFCKKEDINKRSPLATLTTRKLFFLRIKMRYIHRMKIRKVVSKNILLLRWLHGDGTEYLPFLQEKKKKKRNNIAYGWLIITHCFSVMLTSQDEFKFSSKA